MGIVLGAAHTLTSSTTCGRLIILLGAWTATRGQCGFLSCFRGIRLWSCSYREELHTSISIRIHGNPSEWVAIFVTQTMQMPRCQGAAVATAVAVTRNLSPKSLANTGSNC